MRKSRLFPIILVATAACGGSDNKNSGADAAPPDGPGVIVDASADAPPAPPMITISGTAVERTAAGSRPVADATIVGYRNGDDATPVATTTSDASGNYSLTVATGGVALDGYLKATKTGLKDTYLYPPAPLAADTTAPVNMISPDTLNLLNIIAQSGQQAGNGLIAMVVVSGATANSTPVEGATAASTPAASPVRYNNPMSGLPDPQRAATAPDGTAFLFNVPPNVNVVVTAMKTGMTFTAHGLKAWPDQFTTTLVTP